MHHHRDECIAAAAHNCATLVCQIFEELTDVTDFTHVFQGQNRTVTGSELEIEPRAAEETREKITFLCVIIGCKVVDTDVSAKTYVSIKEV